MADKRNTDKIGALFGSVAEEDVQFDMVMPEQLEALQGESQKNISLALAANDIRTGVFKWTSTGLAIDGDISRDDWELTGQALKFMQSSMQWLIGDWLLWGEQLQYGTYEEFASEFGFEVQTIYNYRWVAGKVEISLRKEKLSFGHHNLVAGMKAKEDQAYWLNRAVEGDNGKQWSVATMRAAIKGGETKQLSSADLMQKIFKSEYKKAQSLVDDGMSREVVADIFEKIAQDIRDGK